MQHKVDQTGEVIILQVTEEKNNRSTGQKQDETITQEASAENIKQELQDLSLEKHMNNNKDLPKSRTKLVIHKQSGSNLRHSKDSARVQTAEDIRVSQISMPPQAA